MDKILSVAIIGVGGRGGGVYGHIFHEMKDKYRVNALCNKSRLRLDRFGKEFGVDPKLCFTEEDFFREKRGDVLVVATRDRDHVRQAIRGLELGYDLMLEKPISSCLDECQALLDTQKRTGGKVAVCHELRYSSPFVILTSSRN